MSVDTVVLRLVGAATFIGHRQQPGEAKLLACVGGYGPLTVTPQEAVDALLSGRPVRLLGEDEQAVRSLIVECSEKRENE